VEPAAWNQPPLANTCCPRCHVGSGAAATIGFVATSDLCVAHAGAAVDCAADCAADRAAPTADEQCGRRLHCNGRITVEYAATSDSSTEMRIFGYRQLVRVCDNPVKLLKSLLDNRLIKREARCPRQNCRKRMILIRDCAKCDAYKFHCSKCRTTQSIRKG